MIFIEFFKIFCRVSFNNNIWVRFNFCYFFFINYQSVIELFTQDMIKLRENCDPKIKMKIKLKDKKRHIF